MNNMPLNKKQKTVKEFSLEEKAKKLQTELDEAAKKEYQEVTDFVVNYLESKGYAISARMVLEHGKAPTVIPFITKINKQ